jgi:hypothetical protein
LINIARQGPLCTEIEIWDLERFKVIVHDRVTVDENDIEGLDELTVDKECRAVGGGEKLLPN